MKRKGEKRKNQSKPFQPGIVQQGFKKYTKIVTIYI